MVRSLKAISLGIAVWFLRSSTSAWLEEVYFSRAVSELTITEGHLPERPDPRPGAAAAGQTLRPALCGDRGGG